MCLNGFKIDVHERNLWSGRRLPGRFRIRQMYVVEHQYSSAGIVSCLTRISVCVIELVNDKDNKVFAAIFGSLTASYIWVNTEVGIRIM